MLAEDPTTGEIGPHAVMMLWVHQDTLIDLVTDGDHLTTAGNHEFRDVTDQARKSAEGLDSAISC